MIWFKYIRHIAVIVGFYPFKWRLARYHSVGRWLDFRVGPFSISIDYGW